MTDHVHKYNATLVTGHGRCACGAWSSFDRKTKTWRPPYDPRYAKGLETRLRRLQDPNFEYPREPGETSESRASREQEKIKMAFEREYKRRIDGEA